MRSRFFLIASIGLLLVACNGSGSSGSVACKEYWFNEVGACLPDNWKVLDRAELTRRGVPEEAVVAFQSSEAVSGQFPTISVTREPLAAVTTPAAFSEATIRAVTVLPGYKLIDQGSMKIDGVSLPLHTFQAQPVDGEPQRRFMQVSTVVGEKTGYTVTVLTPLTVSSALQKEIQQILGSVTFVEPTAK